MADPVAVTAWVERYVAAWRSNDPADIGALFTDDARYHTEPHRPPWRGREKIIREWLARRDDFDTISFEWSPVAVTDDVAVVQGVTAYPDRRYSNLWIIRLAADGRCDEFTEWWMKHPKPRRSGGGG
jgi:hypothetical protein